MSSFFDIFLHLDHFLPLVFNHYGNLMMVFLFAIIFIETGLIFFPFLPGDSLLFATGLLCASTPSLHIGSLWLILGLAAILGNKLNYVIGRFLGEKILIKGHFIKQNSLKKSQDYFDSKGGKAIILSRFIPIFRSFVPFLAGITGMSYRRFSTYNLIGGITWTGLFLLSGYFFANIPIVKNHFSLVILIIMALSLIPPAIDLIRAGIKKD